MRTTKRREEVADIAHGFEQMLRDPSIRHETERFVKKSGTLSIAHLEKQFTR